MAYLLIFRVVASSAHAAFDKAASYFGIKLISVPVDPFTYSADIEAMKKEINSNTIMVNLIYRIFY
jgi:sphinganine-1-phosphate aldolase